MLVAVLLIVGGAFLAVRLTGSDDERPIRPWLYRMDDRSLANISVTHQGQTVEYSKKPGTFDWYIQGTLGTLVFQDQWGGKPLLLSGPKVSRVLADELDNPANFGLEPPETQVIISDRSGNTIEFHLGDATPDSVDQYARLVGEDALFTVPIVWGDVVNSLATDPPYLRLFQVDIQRMKVIEVSYQEQITAYRKDAALGPWVIAEPDIGPVSQEKWGDTPQLISGPKVDDRIALEFENAAQYGLDPPEAQVVVGVTGVVPVVFHLGIATEDGKHRYARVLGKPELYIMPIDRAQRIIDLAINPPS